jgi:hypothetical protein
MKGQLESARAKVQELKSNLTVQSHPPTEGADRRGLKDDSQEVSVRTDTHTDTGKEPGSSIAGNSSDVIPETFEGVLSELKGIFTSKMNQQMDANGTLQMKIKDLENRLHLKSLEVTEVRENLDSQMMEFKGALGELTAVRTFKCVCVFVCVCVCVCVSVCVCVFVCVFVVFCLCVVFVFVCVCGVLFMCVLCVVRTYTCMFACI